MHINKYIKVSRVSYLLVESMPRWARASHKVMANVCVVCIFIYIYMYVCTVYVWLAHHQTSSYLKTSYVRASWLSIKA